MLPFCVASFAVVPNFLQALCIGQVSFGECSWCMKVGPMCLVFSQATVLVVPKLSSALKVVLQHMGLHSESHQEFTVPTKCQFEARILY